MPPPQTITDQLMEALQGCVYVLNKHQSPMDVDLLLATILAVQYAETVLARARKVRDLEKYKEGA